ncbi:MAG: leucine-rich repeat domain-containing protein, partial [Paludibacteraceae bacterium]|nr:leucine-rich repeat domain-containing protein [Paludibacteraceae bacterium]
MNKLTTFFVALICASSIFAADYNCEIRGICYGLDTTDMTAEVIKNYYLTTRLELDLYSGSIVIPSKITYKKQTYSVTKIGIGAFAWCDGLKSVKIPNSVTTIGDGAFFVCSGLKSVTIPNSVTTIGERAFYNVNNIVYEGAATGSPWGAKCINGYRRGNLIYSDASKTTLCGCSSTAKGKVTIPNSVTTIGDGAFFVCSGLKSV